MCIFSRGALGSFFAAPSPSSASAFCSPYFVTQWALFSCRRDLNVGSDPLPFKFPFWFTANFLFIVIPVDLRLGLFLSLCFLRSTRLSMPPLVRTSRSFALRTTWLAQLLARAPPFLFKDLAAPAHFLPLYHNFNYYKLSMTFLRLIQIWQNQWDL